jgi:uncharacterized protein
MSTPNIPTITTTAIDECFSTAAQIRLDDVASIAALGFKTLINCRPDGEADAQQPSSADIAALAEQYGLQYAYFPVISGTSGEEYAGEMAATLSNTPLPILSFCRSGTRAGKLYALAQTIQATKAQAMTAIALETATENTQSQTHATNFKLTAFESRVLGVLLEKRFLTPDTYPLSLNSLTLGCNQLTAREPIMALSETAVKDTLELLQERKLIAPRQQAGARVIKYEHRLYQHANLDDEMLAVLCVLLLRGPQTLGEIKQRTDRMVGFADLPAVQATLERLGDLRMPYALALPKAPGTKEVRYVECLSDDEGRIYSNGSSIIGGDNTSTGTDSGSSGVTAGKGRLGELEDEVSRLKRDLESLTNAFLDFKNSFN